MNDLVHPLERTLAPHDLVYPRERTLGALTLALGLLVWAGLIIGTFGVALVVLALGFLLYLFVQSSLISYIKGNGVALSARQFPDLHGQFVECCARLDIKTMPQAYILNGNGGLNAFATKFLGTQYVVLMSDVVDAMDLHTDGVRFYIGHELGHLRMKHLNGHLLRWPVLWLPLLGAAYSRARESTCDRHGRACSTSPEGAARALAALAAGGRRWRALDVAAYLEQTRHSAGFWMSFHELTAGYPWLSKRAARVMDSAAAMPKRNPFAYLAAMFVPYAGRLGAGFGMLILVYVIAVIAAVAVPAYQAYTMKARTHAAMQQSEGVRAALANYYQKNRKIPSSLSALGVPLQQANGNRLELDTDNMVLKVAMEKDGSMYFSPSEGEQGAITWTCSAGDGLKVEFLPQACREDAP